MSMQQQLESRLAALQPEYLEVLNESHMHSRGEDSHFKTVVVSEAFGGLNSVKRHQKVYACLGELMQQIHALALYTYTPGEWAQQASVPDSPTCRGGGKLG